MAEPSTPAAVPTGEPAPGTAAPATAAPAAAPAQATDTPPDYDALLKTIPDDVLRKHDRVNGFAGDLANRRTAALRAQWEADAARKATEDKEQEMLAEAEANPFAFSQRYLKDKAQERVRREFQDVENRAKGSIAQRLGAAYRDLTPEQLAEATQRARASIDKGEDELVAFHTAAVDILAEGRATQRTESELTKRLATEKEAWTKEAQAKRLGRETVPDLMGAKGAPGALDPGRMTDKEFDTWYAANMLR